MFTCAFYCNKTPIVYPAQWYAFTTTCVYYVCVTDVGDTKVGGREEDESSPTPQSPLMHIESFLEALTNADRDGRIVINKQGRHSSAAASYPMVIIAT